MGEPDTVDYLTAHVEALTAAIRAHRDMAWDDRCLEDDKALYAVLNEPIPNFALPPADDMLESCRRYIEQRGCPVASLPPGKMTIRQLEDHVTRLRRLLRAATSALRSYQYGNAAPDIAVEIADLCDEALKEGGEQ